MTERNFPAAADDYPSKGEELERLEAAMDVAPRGAVVVSGIAVGLLLLSWLMIYVFVFLPRGRVG